MSNGITLSGLWSIPGAVVGVMIAGLDCGNYLVGSDGTVTVPFGSDPDGLLTGGYLNSVSNAADNSPALTSLVLTDGNSNTLTVYVPIVMGYVYSSQGRVLRQLGEAQTKTPEGPALGKTRRTHWWSGLFQGAQGVSIGTSFSKLDPVIFTDSGGNALTHDTIFAGVIAVPLTDNYGFDSQLTWQITRPYACTIVSLGAFLETQER